MAKGDLDLFQGGGAGIGPGGFPSPHVERIDIVQTQDVIHVAVGINHGVQMGDVVLQHLGSEIHGSIDDDIDLAFNQQGGPQPLVLGVGRGTHLALTTDGGNSTGGAGAQKGDLH